MKLRSLEVQGFKTFPDKTKLDFTEGITAVVGPNGSGKSNISDAIRWVLGEQSAKALRCSKMEDVIFNGTQQRKKTGYAQVTLSIDNSDRALHFDRDEVSVTRRYYRSGNSEYLINNTIVRLQDIHELFMDTGLGRDGYSMIGQGKIDSIVSTKGEDRREIFEEAAGISRFRYKKAEAERRLDRTEENLVRLRDIMTELEGRVEPLRIQSEKAQAFLVYSEEKRGLEIALWLRSLDKSAAAVREQEDKLAVAQSQYDDIVSSLSAIQRESEDIFEKQNKYALQLEQMRSEASESEEQASEKRSRCAVLGSDIRHNEETTERIRGEIGIFEQSGEELEKEIRQKSKEASVLEAKLSERMEEDKRLTDELLRLRTGETASAERIAGISRILAELTARESDSKVEFMTASSAITDLSERKELVENTIKARRSQIETLENIVSDYRKMVTDCEQNIKVLKERSAEESDRISEQRTVCGRLRSEADDLGLKARQLDSKAKMLEELERNLEGFAHSVKAVMKEANKGGLAGIHGPVSRVLKTSSQYSTAIEIALGAAMQNIVTETDSDAKRAIEFLKRHDGGRATFLPMSTIKGRSLNENGLEGCKGFIGTASELCTCDDCYKGILLNLLGRIVVAENLDCALEIAKKYSYRFKIVTLDGQVVNAGGSLTGGSLSKNTGLLGRATEIEKLKAASAEAQRHNKDKLKKLEEQSEVLSELEEKLEATKREIAVSEGDKIKLEAEIRSRHAELDSTEGALKDSEAERADSIKKMEQLTSSMEEARRKMDICRKEISENEEQLRMLSGSRDELAKSREELGEKLQQVKMEILEVKKDIESVKTAIDNSKQRKNASDERLRSSRDEIASIAKRNQELAQEMHELEEQAEALVLHVQELKKGISDIGAKRLELEARSNELRKNEREKTTEREKLGGELARLEERRQNLRKSYEDTVSKLWDEYELTKREAEECASKIEDVGKAQRRLSELKQKIKSLGSVNVSAIEEYKDVKARYEFMSVQIGDVEKSKAELLRLIGDLTKQMREIFIERFRLINQNFSETFVELFGGGKASLSLADPENVLTTGIDISVEPPGKIVSHIELLSGGEKALVAIALYFAIMKVSPAPFCVMDEIEAALDDVNVYRFAEYLRRMNDNTQFICITHRRGTMEEADVLYGVTMQDRGISKLLELKASELEQKLGIKA